MDAVRAEDDVCGCRGAVAKCYDLLAQLVVKSDGLEGLVQVYPGRVDVRGEGLLEVCPVEARGQVALLDLALVVVYRDGLAGLVMPCPNMSESKPKTIFAIYDSHSLVNHGMPRLIPEGNIGAQRIVHTQPIQGPHPIWPKRN